MNWLTRFYCVSGAVVLPVVLLFTGGCNDKFNTAAPYKNIAIVYSYLEMTDTAHYVRIEKAFSDQQKSSFSMAQVADSNFFGRLNVRVERLSYPVSGKWHDTIHLNLVDLSKEGYPKQQGLFFNAPNLAYKFTDPLDPNYLYRLVATNLLTGETDSADAPVINDLDKSVFYIELLDFSNETMEFTSVLASKTFQMSAVYNNPVSNFSFEGQPGPAGVAQAIIRFNWVDSNNITQELTNRSFDYNFGYVLGVNVLPGSPAVQFNYEVENLTLYSAIFAGMGNAPPNIFRLINKCEIIVFLSTIDFYNYAQASNIQNTGITGTYAEPIASNIKGTDAIGLFTARAMRSGTVLINPSTVDSLMVNPLLLPLRICGAFYR
jgi:hypothetical protein